MSLQQKSESLLGQEQGTIAGWTGDRGDVTATATSTSAGGWDTRLDLVFERLKAAVTGRMADGIVSIETVEPATLTLTRAALVDLLTSEEDGGAARLSVAEDMNAELVIRSMTAPTAMFGDEPFDPAAFELDVEMTGGPLRLSAGNGEAAIEDLRLGATSQDISRGIQFALLGNTSATDVKGLSAEGKVFKLLDDAGRFKPGEGVLALNATLDNTPTMLLDVLGGLDGMLVAALGPMLDATLEAHNFSKNTGRLSGRLETENGFLEGLVRGREESLRVPPEEAITGELAITQELSQQLLKKIHPIFADIRQTENPLTFSVKNLQLPLDGNTKRLRADLAMNVGAVELDSGSLLLKLLSYTKSADKTVIPGRIEPIAAQIRGGVVTYDRFAVVIDKYTMLYTGKVNLNTKKLDLRTELPLEGLAMSIKELKGYADSITVPIVTVGTFEKPETKVDPQFNLAGEAAKAGFKGALNELFGGDGDGDGGGVDGLLKDLLGGDKKKEAADPPAGGDGG